MTHFAAWPLWAALVAGCSSSVIVDGSAAPDGLPTGAGCAASPTPPGRLLYGATSATLFGDVLHVLGVLGDEWSYLVLELEPTGPALLVEQRPELHANADWRALGGELHFRARGYHLDVIDAANPRHVVEVASRGTFGNLASGWSGVAFTDHAATFCVRPDNQGVNVAERFDLTTPASPGEAVWHAEIDCGQQFGNHGAAEKSLWIAWREAQVTLWDVRAPGGSILSHAWVTDGAHHYGTVRDVQTDGHVAVASLENEAYVFLYYADPPHGRIVYSSFGPEEKQLLAVADGTAWVLTAAGIAGYDVAHPDDSAKGFASCSYCVPTPLVGAHGLAHEFRALAHDAARLVVADADGHVFVMPIGGAAPIAPLEVVTALPDARCR